MTFDDIPLFKDANSQAYSNATHAVMSSFMPLAGLAIQERGEPRRSLRYATYMSEALSQR